MIGRKWQLSVACGAGLGEPGAKGGGTVGDGVGVIVGADCGQCSDITLTERISTFS